MAGRIKSIFSRKKEEKKRSVLSGDCLLCGACVGVCPADNLTIIGDLLEIGDHCIGCGDCEKICPVEAISLEPVESL